MKYYWNLCILLIFTLIILVNIKFQNPKKLWTNENTAKHINYLGSRIKGTPEQDDPEVINIIRNNYLNSPSTKPYNLSTSPFYKSTKEAMTWPFIHDGIKSILGNKRGGFFVEAGALDGEYLSNTLWLEKDLGWTGLLIESNPLSYKKLLAKNRKAWSSNTCVSTKVYPFQATFVSISEDKHDLKSYNPWIYKGASHLLGYTMAPSYKGIFVRSSNSYSTVQCFPLYSYLFALNRTEVDLVVLDVQGAEDEVVETIPFDKLRIKVFVVEHSAKNSKFDPSFKLFFEEKGYQLIQCFGEPDYVFVKRGEFNIPEQNITTCE